MVGGTASWVCTGACRIGDRHRRLGHRQARRRVAVHRAESEAARAHRRGGQPGVPNEHAVRARRGAIAGIEKLRFFPLEVVSGHGSTLVTPDGRELLDLSATWTACGLGHGHPAVAEAVSRAVRNAPGAGGLSAVHPDSVGLAEDLLALVPGSGERRVYLGHAGSDANDVALRACRHATGRRTVVAFEHSYHGGVGVAMGVSGVHVDAGAPPDADAGIPALPQSFSAGRR